MKILAIIAVVAAIISLAIGTGIVIIDRSVNLLSPNALLRLTDTLLLFAITVLLSAIVLKKKE